MRRIDQQTLYTALPDRSPASHKGDYGRLLLLCGSIGFTGAAALAAMGSLRVGAGLVYLCVPESIYEIEASKLLEPIVIPLPQENGMLAQCSLEKIRPMLSKMDAVLIGPGLGRSATVEKVVCAVLEEYRGPVILDADGINAVAAHKDILRGRTGTTILTPHEGEFENLIGVKPNDRISSAVNAALDLDVIMVLKGHETVTTDGVEVYCNQTGNPGMAVGGSGDVLAGMITGFVGQGIDPLISAACGVWVHGAAGDVCAGELGQYGMLPSDMLKVIPRFLK